MSAAALVAALAASHPSLAVGLARCQDPPPEIAARCEVILTWETRDHPVEDYMGVVVSEMIRERAGE